MKKALLLLAALIFFQTQTTQAQTKPEFLRLDASRQAWVDSVFKSLTPDERIAQLIMVAATSDVKRSLIGTERSNPDYVKKLIRENKVGGVVFLPGWSRPAGAAD